MSAAAIGHAGRRAQLGERLAASRSLWHPQPYREFRPGWCDALPHLVDELLGLDDAEVERLAADPAALHAWLRPHLDDRAAVDEIAALSAVPAADTVPIDDTGPHFDWAIPGRKRAQIAAFAAAIGAPRADVVDWCAGRGHLGRLLAAQWGVDVLGVDRDAGLVDSTATLARRARQAGQRAETVDVLADDGTARLAGRHVVALHACGDLHRHLVGVAAGAAAIDLAPCCYDRMAVGTTLVPFGEPLPGLAFDRGDLKLAVTGTATAAPRETRRRRQEGAWKLGFMALLAAGGAFAYRPLRPLPAAWLNEDFAGFCHRLGEREGVDLPAHPDWPTAEHAGQVRWRRAERLDLLRFAFRRAIEVWLALDLAVGLESAGFRVRLASFCAPALTPRNLLLSARRAG